MSFSSIERAPREAPAERSLREGRLKLEFRSDPDGRTHVADQHAGYPFHLGRALYLDGDAPGMATVYIQSTAGGLFAGDRQRIDITARTGARAHVTTQAATIVHRTAPDHARQSVALTAAADAFLEYMPDATILFPGATLNSALDVTVDDGATVVIGESYIGHDPDGNGTPFEALESTLRIVDRAGRLLALDRYAVTGVEIAARRIGVTGGHGAHGTIAVIDRGRDAGSLAEALRGSLDALGETVYGAASTLANDCGAWARITASDGVALNAAMRALWSAARRALTGHPPGRRRK
jgi:urease accessory protein